LPEAATQIEAGQLVPLVVMSDERLPDFPDVPTAKEAGVDWTTVGWRGLAVPKDTPPELLALLEEKCIAIAHSDAYKEFMRKNSFGITIRGSDEFTQFLEEQDEMWQPVVAAAGYAKE
jgi:tripartite-type tricarboxylate transporter receptor subunit TctC